MHDFLVVELISDDIIPFFDKDKIKKKHCYSNVFNINVEIFSRYKVSDCNNSYVLCYVDGEPHCILKYNGVYYDPTLQFHDCIKDRKYVLVKEFSYKELYKFITDNKGFNKHNGEEYVVPPMLTVKGEIICSECIRP